MHHQVSDTIAAIATAAGGAARGIVRMSGPEVVACLTGCFRPRDAQPLDAVTRARAIEGRLRLPALNTSLPCDLLLWPTGRSYTRQPAAELHTLGSPPLLEAALEAVCQCGARPAEPGEFTLRAFLAGRIDLTQAEAVLGVIDAQGRGQLDLALRQLAGRLAQPLAALRNDLLDLLADLEAGLDFADQDITLLSQERLLERLDQAGDRLERLSERFLWRATMRDRIRIVLTGRPNAGKSSLFNALAEADRAITSAEEGTTRDAVEVDCRLAGVDCRLIDTAGIGGAAPADPLVAAAAHIARQERQEAHVEILCLDVSRPLGAWEIAELARPLPADRRIVVWTKADLPHIAPRAAAKVARRDDPPILPTSSRTRSGVGALRRRLGEVVRGVATADGDVLKGGSALAGTAARSRAHLAAAAEALERARHIAADDGGDEDELVAIELRAALLELGKIVGEVFTDDLLDRIFGRFCLGK